MRVKNSLKNIYISILSQLVIVLLGFISRKVFLDNLGTEYLGINGLLTNILSMLSLVEGGIGMSIVYNLYKPLAENDIEKTTALVQLYKKLYGILAIVIFILSMIMYIFLEKLIKGGTTVPFVGIIYFIFVSKSMVSYLNAHKWSLIDADQKAYIIAKYNLIFNVITTILKIVVLQVTQNYILFLVIELGIFIIQNLYNGKIVNQRYPYVKTKEKYKVDNKTKENLITNVKAIFLHNIGSYCVFGTDNLLISSFVGLTKVGLYSNYTMITMQLSALLNPILSGIGASVGNLIATESKEKNYQIFNIIYLINFWLYSLSVIFLYNLLEPFIIFWLRQDGLLLDKLSFIFILINFYLTGLRSSVITFKTKAGIFVNDKYVPLLEAVINLGTSIILVKYFGLAGIFMGTAISTVSIPLWTQSKLVYNKIFNKSVTEYFKKYVLYICLTLLTGVITSHLCNIIVVKSGFISLVARGIICVIVVNLVYLVIFYKTEEFKYLWNIVKPMIRKLKSKIALS
ncbi:MAG: hypothetical protein E6356_18065 [Terrisporobacter othiniensis]|nr:hypothetical protein [Terrisporobacter othiniensis]MDU6996760.1 hypothetical protein [Terrisporobacter othiniensis]